ncbi:MAG: DsbA family protein [Hyphomicrobiaceae bacterium]|nr:DsbA family protein [Hyphomicrobiaceae bacterium]
MINRRLMTRGLLASLASSLTSCGGLSSGTDAPSSPTKKKSWSQGFGNNYTSTGPNVRERRTSPATVAELMAPGPLKEMSLGNKSAKVTMIEYFSPTCPVCHAFHKKTWPTFKKRYIDTGKVHFIAREFPIGRSSGNAAIAIRCHEKKFFPLMNAYLLQQRRWVSLEVRLDKIYAIARPYGLTQAKLNACLADKTLVENMRLIKERGRDLGVIGTPTFFINGKQLRGALTMAQLQAEIDPLLG